MFYPLAFLAKRRERRVFDPTAPPRWSEVSGGGGYSPVPVTLTRAVGLPAVGAAIRLLCETIAQLPLNVYRGRGAEKRLADQTWQYRLLVELPGMGDFTPFDLISDIVSCLEGHGNAFLLKTKAAGQVIALTVIDPTRVRVERKDGEKRFLVRADGRTQTLTASSILHVRGFTVSGSDIGISPISMHREEIGAQIAQQEYKGRFYGQGANPNSVFIPETSLSIEEAREMKQGIEAQNGSLRNAHLPLVLHRRGTWQRSGLSLEDSQYVEGERLNLTQVAHIFRIPPGLLSAEGQAEQSEQDMLRFYTLSVAPRLRRIEMAFASDADLFPQRIVYPEFDTRALLRTDAKTQAEVDHKEIQSGLILVDEKRAEKGMEPLPGGKGKIPLETPVGGAPNPNPPNQDREEEPVAD